MFHILCFATWRALKVGLDGYDYAILIGNSGDMNHIQAISMLKTKYLSLNKNENFLIFPKKKYSDFSNA